MEGIRRRLNSIELEFGISLKGKKLSLDIKKEKMWEKSRNEDESWSREGKAKTECKFSTAS